MTHTEKLKEKINKTRSQEYVRLTEKFKVKINKTRSQVYAKLTEKLKERFQMGIREG